MGDVIPSAIGCDGGKRVKVSFVPGIRDKRKLKDSPNADKYGRSLPKKFNLNTKKPPKAEINTIMPSACPA